MTVGELIAELEKYDKNYDVTYGCPADSIKVANEWADDTHTLGLTKKGMKLYLQEDRLPSWKNLKPDGKGSLIVLLSSI